VYLVDQHWVRQVAGTSDVEITAKLQPMTLHLITTAVIAVLVQSFLIVRYWWMWVFHAFTARASPSSNID
jgi:hypothetical protein